MCGMHVLQKNSMKEGGMKKIKEKKIIIIMICVTSITNVEMYSITTLTDISRWMLPQVSVYWISSQCLFLPTALLL